MADTRDATGKGSRFWGELSNEAARGVADIGSTYQACLYSGWHTQSAAVDSPEHIAEAAAREQDNKRLEPEHQGPRIGLEKE